MSVPFLLALSPLLLKVSQALSPCRKRAHAPLLINGCLIAAAVGRRASRCSVRWCGECHRGGSGGRWATAAPATSEERDDKAEDHCSIQRRLLIRFGDVQDGGTRDRRDQSGKEEALHHWPKRWRMKLRIPCRSGSFQLSSILLTTARTPACSDQGAGHGIMR